MKKNVSKCVRCQSEKIRSASREQIYQFNDTAFRVKVPCSRCESCGETFTHLQDVRRANREVALDLVRNGGPVTGKSLKHLREATGLTAVELAALLGIAATTLSRWENDKQPIDRATWVAVGDFVLEPELTRKRLDALETSRAGKTIRLSLDPA